MKTLWKNGRKGENSEWRNMTEYGAKATSNVPVSYDETLFIVQWITKGLISLEPMFESGCTFVCVWHMPNPVVSLRGFKLYMQCHARTRTVNVSLFICISLNWYCDYTTAATIECDEHKVRMGELSAAQDRTCKGGWWQKVANLAWQFNMVSCTCIWEFW